MGRKYRMMLMAALCGGMLVQATTATSCQDTLVSSLSSLAVSTLLQVLLGSLGGIAT